MSCWNRRRTQHKRFMMRKRTTDSSATDFTMTVWSNKTSMERSFQSKIQWKESQSDQRSKDSQWQSSPSMMKHSRSNSSSKTRSILELKTRWKAFSDNQQSDRKENAKSGLRNQASNNDRINVVKVRRWDEIWMYNIRQVWSYCRLISLRRYLMFFIWWFRFNSIWLNLVNFKSVFGL